MGYWVDTMTMSSQQLKDRAAGARESLRYCENETDRLILKSIIRECLEALDEYTEKDD